MGFILRADNRGEGGIFALLGLKASSSAKLSPRMRSAVFLGAIFAFMSRNAANPTTFFGIPPNQVIELGAQIRL